MIDVKEKNRADNTNTLADEAARFVREKRAERQTALLYENHAVELTVVQNRWAESAGKPKLGISEAPAAVVRAIERTKRGHELFDRVRGEDGVVVYGLRDHR